jgi:NADH-quinone oxidoreductase subunit N
MASSTKIAAVAAILLVSSLLPAGAWPVLAAVAILSIAVGNLSALLQDNVKRMLAYSSVAHAGTILLAIAAQVSAAGTPAAADLVKAGSEAAVFYLAGYGASVLGAFGVLTILERGGERFASLTDFKGLSRRQPFAAWMLVLFLLSLAGIPPTAGFWAKYLVFAAAIRADFVALSVAGIVLSVVGAAYYLRVIGACFMSAEHEGLGAPPQGKAPLAARLAIVGAAAAVAVLGFLPSSLLERL